MKQKVYKGQRTAKSIVVEFLEDDVERSDEELADLVGISVHTVRTYRQEIVRQSGEGVAGLSGIFEVTTEDMLPLLTMRGWVWCVPETRNRSCKGCEMDKYCREAVRDGNYIACELVLVEELLPE